ncbi:MAG: hypothetical protein SGILL_007156, partial [Bacillariaceae sp.]
GVSTSAQQPAFATNVPQAPAVQFHMGVGSDRGPSKGVGRKTIAMNQRQKDMERNRLLDDKVSNVMVFRDTAKMLYQSGDYSKCILACTSGIDLYRKEVDDSRSANLLGVLHSNRAAALLMVGAYQAALHECTEALRFTSYPSPSRRNMAGSSLSLIPKLFNRRARAHGKLGNIDEANTDFGLAIDAVTHIRKTCPSSTFEGLDHEMSVATSGHVEIFRCRTAWGKMKGLDISRLSSEQSLDAIQDVNCALSFCTGNAELQVFKVKLLSHLKRWRELVRYCERIGAANVKMDGCFPGDLQAMNPMPGVQGSRHLKPDAFDSVSDSDVAGVFFKLNYKAKGEVVLRLPYLARPLYVKGLRLQEDYFGAKECVARIEVFLQSNPSFRNCFSWFAPEKEMIAKTENLRSVADALYASGKFDAAADEYYKMSCLDRNAGGRLNAVMHCNRAACFMAVKKLNEALNEYFQRFIEYAQKAKSGDTSFIHVSPMIFDGPSNVTEDTMNNVKEALNESRKLKNQKKDDEDRRRAEFAQRQWRSERFHSDTQRRRENFYTSSSRPWDSFANRGMAKKYHPDKSNAPNAADNFRRIQEAYETLQDDQSRRQYDRERRRGF